MIPTMKESLRRLNSLHLDIKLIREKDNIGLSQLARTLGIDKKALWLWQKGKMAPRDPFILLCIITWADKIRAREQKEQSAV